METKTSNRCWLPADECTFTALSFLMCFEEAIRTRFDARVVSEGTRTGWLNHKRGKQIWEVKLKEDPLQHLERVKFVQFYSKAHAVCVFMCVCVSTLLQSAATTCTQQTAKWPTGDGRVMWIPALCLYYSPLRSLAGLRVLIACGLPPTSYVFFFFFAGAPSRSYGNQHQHSDQTATAAFPSVCVFFFFLGWKEVCVICAYDFITVFSSYVAQS